jgi:amino acid transporter
VQAARNVPKGMLRSVYLSGLVGWVMVAAFVLAMPDVADAAGQGADVFAWLMKRVAPGRVGAALWVAIVVSNYLCGLACMTSTSRMMYAFARDGGLPWSRAVSRVSPRRQTPVVAIWTTAVLVLASTAYAPVYSTLTAACVVFLYLSYVMPTLVGLRALGRTWTRMGPFDVGRRAYRCLGVVALGGTTLVVWIGVQPPNQKALWVTIVMVALLLAAWWLGVRRIFRGPPVPPLTARPDAATASTRSDRSSASD